MPKKKIDYSNTIIYKIFCRDTNIKEVYIGHTTNFVNRKSAHKSSSKNSESKLYTYIRENGGWENWKILIIDDVECNNFEEARKVEQNYIDKYNSGLNTAIAFCIKDEDSIVSKKEKRETKIYNTENYKKYTCHNCNFFTLKKTDYERHLLTDKHKKLIIDENNDSNKNEFIKEKKDFICKCGKKYTYKQGLSFHKKKCMFENKCVEIIENNKYEISNDVLKKHLKLIQDLEEIKSKLLIKE